ncbi:hypothetical protein KIN20_010411 [Parelaphostrongylus tenuis]|uniref:Uncharacterized protein n=1 Tax=Parelaphostrongylus tenuis TaxID=148309 RepID=A0AAD5MTC8_PARTN|nr:hypothetical protein KIN20_010411 [Parelaphostrongylus tenuis]
MLSGKHNLDLEGLESASQSSPPARATTIPPRPSLGYQCFFDISYRNVSSEPSTGDEVVLDLSGLSRESTNLPPASDRLVRIQFLSVFSIVVVETVVSSSCSPQQLISGSSPGL